MKPILALALSALFVPFVASAANPSLVITWKASSYVPPGYAGKALATTGSALSAQATIIDNGRVISPSSYSVRWYEAGNLSATLGGSTVFRSSAPRMGEDSFVIRASIPDYGEGTLDAFADIPVTRPEIVIDSAKLPTLSPIFYFWNITDPASLSVEWSSDQETTTLRAKNPSNPFEFAQTTISKEQ